MMDSRIQKTLEALESNNITAVYTPDSAAAVDYVKSRLTPGCSIRTGGSVSLAESGVLKLISDPEYNFRDRNAQGITKEEQLDIYRTTIGCDFFLCSANAVTENGEIINVDGFANRISAIPFGPKNVIMIVGRNKIVADLKEGFLRVKRIAAPKNSVRLGLNNPCAKLGHCVSLLKNESPDICGGCKSPSRICRNYLVSAMQAEKGRITVVIVGEELGY